MPRFEAGAAVLRGDAAHHLGRVLRAEPGQLFELSDTQSVWLARAERVGRDSIEFKLVEPLPAPVSRLRITIFLSIVKFDRFEWALEKATELGADEIVPLAAERSEKGLVSAAGNARRDGRRSFSRQRSRRAACAFLPSEKRRPPAECLATFRMAFGCCFPNAPEQGQCEKSWGRALHSPEKGKSRPLFWPLAPKAAGRMQKFLRLPPQVFRRSRSVRPF